MCHEHVQWPPREVQEEVTSLGVALGGYAAAMYLFQRAIREYIRLVSRLTSGP